LKIPKQDMRFLAFRDIKYVAMACSHSGDHVGVAADTPRVAGDCPLSAAPTTKSAEVASITTSSTQSDNALFSHQLGPFLALPSPIHGKFSVASRASGPIRTSARSKLRSSRPTYQSPRLISFGFASKVRRLTVEPYLQPSAMNFAIITQVLIASGACYQK